MNIKNKIAILFITLISHFGIAQIVTIPDANFKNKLLLSSDSYPNTFARDLNGDYVAIDANADGEIQYTEAENISYLAVYNSSIFSLQGIEAFVNLEYLGCTNNQLTALDISALINLKELQASTNNITSIDFSSNLNLEDILMESNLLTTVDLSNQYNLDFVSFNYNQLESMFFKTGSEPHVVFVQNPIQYICVDDSRVEHYKQYLENFVGCTNCVVNSYCSFSPGGNFSTIQGNTRLDLNANGCDVSDNLYPNIKLNINNGTLDNSIIADNSGYYNLPLQDGNYTITPQFENLDYFTITPSNISVNFPTNSSPYTQDFCIIPNGIHNDIEIIVIPLNEARPGFEANYKIIYNNKGNSVLSGDINVLYNDDYLDLQTTTPNTNTQATGSLTWNYSNLLPFETREIEFTMLLNTPTNSNFPLNGGDNLNYTATINPVIVDEAPNDNTSTLNQTVVNSYDPNDITCIEGERISPEKVGDYVHYLIRFENTGTTNAVNVVVKTDVDMSKYDVSSIIPLNASHDFYSRIKNENELEFIFENIQLPFDDANNDGYVLFKIKTLSSLVLGNSFSKSAEIYFDFNFPIITNTATTLVEETLSVDAYTYNTSSVFISPNPVSNNLNIKANFSIKTITIYDINGRLLNSEKLSDTQLEHQLDVSNLSNGVYFLEIQSNNIKQTKKFIKN